MHRHARIRDRADGRHVPREWRTRLDEDRESDLGLARVAARLPHRRLAEGGRVGAAVSAGRLRDRAERRADPAARRSGGAGAHARVRRPAGGAQGTGGAAASVAGDPSADRRAAARDRRRSARRPPAARAAPRQRRRARHPGLPRAGAADERAAADEGARRAVARRRELRHGAHARVGVRDSGRRVRHPRLPRGADSRSGGRVSAR